MAAQHAGLSSVPETIPGQLVQDPDHVNGLRTHLALLTKQPSLRYSVRYAYLLEAYRTLVRFPGSQPVSFDYKSLELLMQEE